MTPLTHHPDTRPNSRPPKLLPLPRYPHASPCQDKEEKKAARREKDQVRVAVRAALEAQQREQQQRRQLAAGGGPSDEAAAEVTEQMVTREVFRLAEADACGGKVAVMTLGALYQAESELAVALELQAISPDLARPRPWPPLALAPELAPLSSPLSHLALGLQAAGVDGQGWVTSQRRLAASTARRDEMRRRRDTLRDVRQTAVEQLRSACTSGDAARITAALLAARDAALEGSFEQVAGASPPISARSRPDLAPVPLPIDLARTSRAPPTAYPQPSP